MMLIYFMMDTRQAHRGSYCSIVQLDVSQTVEMSFNQDDTGACVPPAGGSGWAGEQQWSIIKSVR